MFIDMHVHPAFYEPINQDSELEELRHNTLDIHKNGTAQQIMIKCTVKQMKRCMKIKECGKSVNVAENYIVIVVQWMNACVYVCRKKERTVKEK